VDAGRAADVTGTDAAADAAAPPVAPSCSSGTAGDAVLGGARTRQKLGTLQVEGIRAEFVAAASKFANGAAALPLVDGAGLAVVGAD